MAGSFSGIELGKRGLMAHSSSLHTAGHNISNASTEGYSRQRVNLTTMDPLYNPALNRAGSPGMIGQGVNVGSIERIRDMLLEKRIVAQASGKGFWEVKDRYLLMMEQSYLEPPTDATSEPVVTIRELMDKFWDAWQELSNSPEQIPPRNALVQRSEALMHGIKEQFYVLKEIRDMIDEDLVQTVNEVNSLLQRISDINVDIRKSEALGDNPNDLLDRRDLLVKNLSEKINIEVSDKDPAAYNLHMGGRHLIQGENVNFIQLEANPNNDGYSDLQWAWNGENFRPDGGKLAALVELRDLDARTELQRLNSLAINMSAAVNEVHRNSYGLNKETGNDFFVDNPFIRNALGNFDSSGDGDFDSTLIFQVSGSNRLDLQSQVGISGVMTLSGAEGNVDIVYNPTDTVREIVERINFSNAEIVASVNSHGHLQLKATGSSNVDNRDFVIRHIEDSGHFLAGYSGILQSSGADAAFTFDTADAVLQFRGGDTEYQLAPDLHPAAWMQLNPVLKNNVAAVAAGAGWNSEAGPSGDNSAALSIAGLRHKDIMISGHRNVDEFFAVAMAELGMKGRIAEDTSATESLRMKLLEEERQSISGVNMDEEFANIIKFQHGYNAAARFINEIDKMLEVIINRMGV